MDRDTKIDLTGIEKREDNCDIYLYKKDKDSFFIDLQDILFAPPEYWKLTTKEHEIICNGAGPKGWGWIVPDTIWGLNITHIAGIHDFGYYTGKTIEDKNEHDRIFLNNMVRWILYWTKWKIMKWLRLGRAQKYFSAVCIYGGPAFWKGKNEK